MTAPFASTSHHIPNAYVPGCAPALPRRSSFRSDSGNLDLIRAVAVLGVFVGHLIYLRAPQSPSLLPWHFAQMGVLVFFVHTSFVLMLSLERTPLTGGSLAMAFYLRRFFRLYPFSMVCVTVAMLWGMDHAVSPPHAWTWGQYASNMLLTTNLTYTDIMVGGLWTLPIEVQMYLVLPLLFFIGRRYHTRVLVALWLLALPIAWLQPQVSGRLNVLGFAPCFLAGVLAWKLSLTVQRRYSGRLWPLAFLVTWPVWFAATHETDVWFRWTFCFALGLTLPWFQEIRDGMLKRLAHTIATYSYGIYLTHLFAMETAFHLPVAAPVQWLALAALTVGLPLLAYHGVEQPMINAGQWFARRYFFVPTSPVAVEVHPPVRPDSIAGNLLGVA